MLRTVTERSDIHGGAPSRPPPNERVALLPAVDLYAHLGEVAPPVGVKPTPGLYRRLNSNAQNERAPFQVELFSKYTLVFSSS